MASSPSCCHQLYTDHETTRILLKQLQEGVQQENSITQLMQTLNMFKQTLAHHYACEQLGLFPVLNLYRPMVLLEVEHDDLTQAQEQFEIALQQKNWSVIQTTFNLFADSLNGHMLEEERGVFPLADTLLEPEERQLVERKISEISALTSLPTLNTPEPIYQKKHYWQEFEPSKPIRFQTLFDTEQTQVQQIQLTAGEELKRHWSPQHQCLLLLSGELLFITDQQTERLTAGAQISLSPHLWFSLQAIQSSELFIIKVWPKPYFLRGLARSSS